MKAQLLTITLYFTAWLGLSGWHPSLAQAGLLSGMHTPLDGVTDSINLTSEGQFDWAYWGYAIASDFDQKDGGTNRISNYIQIGPNSPRSYNNSASIFHWEDGTPDTAASGMTSGIYFIGVNNGYEVTVAADETPQLLNIYVGAWAAAVHFEASLSDGSAPAYIDETFSRDALGGANRRYTVIFAASSPGQTLRVKAWVLSTVDINGNVTLQAASLAPVPPLSVTQPVAAPGTVIASGTPVQLTVEAQGAFPYSYQWFVDSGHGYLPIVNTDTNTLRIDTTGFHGDYMYRVVVTNTSGGAVTSAPVTLTARLATGFLRLSSSDLATVGQIDLTAEGATDWAHWGLTLPNDFTHKAGVPSQIGDYTPIGASQLDYFQFGNNAQGYTWTDGTPTLEASNSTTGVFIAGLGRGFQIEVAAEQTNQLLNLYAGVYTPGGNLARLHLEAALSDASAPTIIDESASGIENRKYSIVFGAGSPGQKLILRYWVLGATDGDVFLQAATLSPLPSLNASAPEISPTNVVALGSTVRLTTQVQGLFPYTYSWRVGHDSGYSELPGSDTNTIWVTPAATGIYSYQVVVSNSAQVVTSPASLLAVTPATATLTAASENVPPPGTVSLTDEGALDWAAWGLNLATDFDHKAGVTSQIANFTPLGGWIASGQYGNNTQGYSWEDGTPTSSVTNSTTGIWVAGLSAGYELEVPAAVTPRVLKVYLGAYMASAHFEAHLSDGSAPYYVDESFTTKNPSGSSRVYTITYASAAEPKPTLLLRYWQLKGSGNITLSAASLRELPAANLQLRALAGGDLQISWTTGTLLEATDLSGPWVTNSSTSPHTFAPAGQRKFFKVQLR